MELLEGLVERVVHRGLGPTGLLHAVLLKPAPGVLQELLHFSAVPQLVRREFLDGGEDLLVVLVAPHHRHLDLLAEVGAQLVSCRHDPHPNPLPEGEGACRSFASSCSTSAFPCAGPMGTPR